MQVQRIETVFKYNGRELQVPAGTTDPELVRRMYSPIYPELNNAAVDRTNEKGKVIVTFQRQVGTKG